MAEAKNMKVKIQCFVVVANLIARAAVILPVARVMWRWTALLRK